MEGGDGRDAAAGGTHSTDAPRAAGPLPAINPPKGGGAVRPIDEKFRVSPITGTAALTLPLFASPGRGDLTPRLELSYDSGAGNGPFGLGWSLTLPSITRKTDKGLPRYRDGEESDVFILAGAEDLVPLLDEQGDRVRMSRTLHGVAYAVHLYRPRVEGLFARVERWQELDTGISRWRTITRDNVATLFGWDEAARIADPSDPRRVASYLITRAFDDRGNVVVYDYVAEDPTGVDLRRSHEAERRDGDRRAQRYVKSIRYGGAEPYFPAWGEQGPEEPLPASWHFEVVFDYGDHGPQPTPARDRAWPVRPDPFSSYRSGFEVRTYRRCQRVLMFHHFPGEPGVGSDCIVRSTEFAYADAGAQEAAGLALYSLLTSAVQAGYRRSDGGYVRRPMPPVEFDYSEPELQGEVAELDHDSALNLPEGIDGSRYRLVDLDGDGLPGILSDTVSGWSYKRNLGPSTPTDEAGRSPARFGVLGSLPTVPSRTAVGSGMQLLDVSGNGHLDVVALGDAAAGWFERTAAGGWTPFRTFDALPNLDWADPNLRFADLTGDGLADVLVTEEGRHTFYPSLGEGGYAVGERVAVGSDERRGPAVMFADGTQTVVLADMSGDGLSDLVRVRSGEVSYWPSLGYGRFGARVTMDAAPRLDHEEGFDPARVRLADIDGSGTTDLVYVGVDGVDVCFNRSGNSWGPARRLAIFPTADASSAVQVGDLLGTGTGCLVWSTPLETGTARLRYVDLMGGRKPHLLTRQRNNLGVETRLHYAPSTRFLLADERAGTPWRTRLPFPVHVVERVEVYDWIGRSRFVTRYAYHHGHFDGREREFRGFGLVDQWDTEEHRADTAFPEAVNWDPASWSPPVRTRTWFHTGASPQDGVLARAPEAERWVEPALRPQARAADREAMELGDTVLPAGLTGDELREAHRALKGSVLRSEVYAADGSPRAEHPYSVTAASFTVRLVQPRGENRHAVVFVHAREMLSLQYERRTDDPRATHDVTLEVDPFGNVLRRVSVALSRRAGHPDPEPALSADFRAMLAHDQARLHVAATEAKFTNALADPAAGPDLHRTPLPAETIVAELTGVAPAATRPGITNRFTFAELDAIWQAVWDGAHDVPYEEITAGDIDGVGLPPPGPARRILERRRSYYRRDDLTELCPLGVLESRALAGETYHLAMTPGLVGRIFDDRISDALLAQGGYVQVDAGAGWWVPSGRVYLSAGDGDTPAVELAAAQAHFYMPRRVINAFGAVARVSYDTYDLLPTGATDPVGNTTAAANDYRVLVPSQVTDSNGNRVEAAIDALGYVVGIAVRGKATESLGDSLVGFDPDPAEAVVRAHLTDPLTDPGALLGSATTRTLYDLFAYHRTRADAQPAPLVVHTLSREIHVSELAAGQDSPSQPVFAYLDGFGREIQRKMRAEGDRWLGSGWTIFDNKAKPVRTYEPFFSDAHDFELANTAGVSTVSFYDPKGRMAATLRPNGTWEKVVFDVWRLETWDVNDTVMVADPRLDPDVGDHFSRLLGPGAAAFTSWHDQRIGGTLGNDPDERAAEQDAAQKTAAHAATPTVAHFDALGRTCLRVTDGGPAGRIATRVALDPESKQLAVLDALGRRVYEYCRREPRPGGGFRYLAGYDMTGHPLYRNGMDDGERRSLADVMGRPLALWSPRGDVVRTSHDLAGRITHRFVRTGNGPERLLERLFYGEGRPDRNLCGRPMHHYDSAGLAGNERYDFAGNLVQTVRQLAREHRSTPDWSALDAIDDADAAQVAAAAMLDPDDRFVSSSRFDALHRAVQVVPPHSAQTRINVLQPVFNEANLLERIDAWLAKAAAPSALLDPATADMHPLTAVAYNARGQSIEVGFGNGTVTTRDHDPLTFQLSRMRTARPAAFAADKRVVQDLHYCYDPVGNVTRVRDTADTQNVVFFANQRVEPTGDYAYDALYRLVRATGREHLGQTAGALSAPQQVGSDDTLRMALPHPSDGNAMGTYVESYAYDPVGNLTALVHSVSSGSWVRRYAYDAPSQITPTQTGNRLSATSLPGDPVDGPYSLTYDHDVAGNMVRMPHLPQMTWDERDRLRSTTRQVVNAGTPETTYSVYDADGGRVRKVTDRQAPAGQEGKPWTERLYVGPIEIHRLLGPDGTTVTLQRETLHISAGPIRVAMYEVRTVGTDPAPAQLMRYQCSNHLGSAGLELDQAAEIISYEEYFPFGATAYQAVRSQTETPRRYGFTGKERDEESGLLYHGARFYAPWIGRWTAPDPTPSGAGGPNLYLYAHDNPVKFVDPDGRDVRLSVDQATHTITFATTVHFFGTAAELKQMKPLVQQAEAFYSKPTVESETQTQARLATHKTAPTPGSGMTFTDQGGTTWTVRFDVKYQLHDIAKTPPAVTQADVAKLGANAIVKNLPSDEAKLKASVGFNPGDNVMTFRPQNAGIGGKTTLLTSPDTAAPTFGKPESRMLASVGQGTKDIVHESVIHETGHLLGFDERYESTTGLAQNHNDFGWDFMSSAGTKSPSTTTMHPTHIADAARFGIGVANGNSLVDKALRGPQIDATGTRGDTQEIVNGAVNPAYTARQATLRSELLPFYRAQAGSTTAPAAAAATPTAPPPVPAVPPRPTP